ncbi:MAG: FAD-dependent oxidoreductase [Actinomycetota bacterium]|nr:FAD-dependent oxidoreductase [Actinomycetota bacterium]
MTLLKFIRKEKNAQNVYSFIFEAPDDFRWIAGQFIQITFPHDNPDSRGIKRFFSISSAPYEKKVMVTTRFDNQNGSSFKKAFYDITPGTFIESTLPKGKFIVDKKDKKIILIAGGIGITPIRSIIFDLDHDNNLKDIDLLYSNRDNDIAFKEEIENKRHNNFLFNIYYFISPILIREETLSKIYEVFPNCYAYVSGPPAMVKSITDILYSKGMTAENIKADYFPGY